MKVVWSENALNDLKEIQAYISADSVYYALCVVERILDKAASLEDMPQMGHVVPESFNGDVREIHSAPYRIIYSVSSDCVGIVTIVHMARNIKVLPDDE